MPTNVGARAKQLYAEIVLKDSTGDGAASSRANIESIGVAAEETNRIVARTDKIYASAERAYQRLQGRIEPLVRLQQKLERDEQTLNRARQQGVISVETYERSLRLLGEEYDRGEARLERLAQRHSTVAKATNDNVKVMRDAATAAAGLSENYEKQEQTLSTLANTTVNTVGSIAGLLTGMVSLKLAQKDAIDLNAKLSLGLGILSRVLPVAGVIALALAFVKLGVEGAKAINRLVASSVQLASVQREAEGQVASAITSTGAAAGRSIEDIRAVADELQNLSNTADEVSIRAGAQLLTFTNIRGDNFDRTLRIGNDVAARLQRDPEQVALQLGKALNDPVRNLGALTESGIQFSDGQRNLIQSLSKVGEIATAQAIILAELENQFQGAAAAQREAAGGAIALENAWGDLKEELGDGIIAKTADETDRVARAVGDPVWKFFFGIIGDIVGQWKALQLALRGSLLQGAADMLRGISIIAGEAVEQIKRLRNVDLGEIASNAADGFERLTGIDVRGFFAGIGAGADIAASALERVNGLVEDSKEKIVGLYQRLPEGVRNSLGKDSVVRDALVGGPLLGGVLVTAGIGRRARESDPVLSPTADTNSGLQAEADVADRLDQSYPKIIKHYADLKQNAQEYYEVANTGGSDALEAYVHQEELLKSIDEITKGFPAEIAEEVRQHILATDAIERKTAALRRDADEIEKRAAVLAGLQRDNDQLRDKIGAARQGSDQLAELERQQSIELKIQTIKQNTKGIDEARLRVLLEQNNQLTAGLELAQRRHDITAEIAELGGLIDAAGQGAQALDYAERRRDVEREIADLKDLADRAGEDFDEVATRDAIQERNARRAVLDGLSDSAFTLERDLNSVADNFFDRFVREGRLSFKELGRDLKSVLLDTVLNPFRNALRSLLNGLFSGAGPFSIFGGGVSEGVGAGAVTSSALSSIAAPILGGFTGLAAGQGVSDLLGLQKGSTARRLTSGAVGGAVGGTLASSLFFAAGAGAPIGTALGLGAAAGGPVGAIAGLVIGGLLAAFSGKPSSREAASGFDPVSGRVVFSAQDGPKSEANAQIRDAIVKGVSDIVGPIAQEIGAVIRDDPKTAANESKLRVGVNNFDGIKIGAAGPGQTFRFENTEEGAKQAIEQAARIAFANLDTKFDAVDTFLDKSLAQGLPIEEIVQGIRSLSALFESIDELDGEARTVVDSYVKAALRAGVAVDSISEKASTLAGVFDAFEGPVDQFKQQLEEIKDAFDGLGVSTAALRRAYDRAIDRLASSANEENQKALDAIINPQRALLADQLEALIDRRSALSDINKEGGNVSLGLFDDLARRQLLSGFNIEERLSKGADPARASIDAFRDTQRKELEALQSLIGKFGITLEDEAALRRSQVFERRAFFETIPEEDRLRLAGEGDEFLDLSGRYELAVDRLLEESERLVDGFEDRAAELRDIETRERAGALDLERAIQSLDSRFGQGNPAQRVDIARANVQDLRDRALVADDTEDRQFARDQLPKAVNDLIDIAQRAGASSPIAQEALAFGRGVLVEVKEARTRDADNAAASLATLEESRDLLENIRDILASPELDAAALAERVNALPEGFDSRDVVKSLATELLEIQQAQFEQNDRIAAALEALSPEDVGLTAPETSANDNAASRAPAAFTGSDAAQSAPPRTATEGGGSTEASKETDVVTALYTVAKGVDKLREQNETYYSAQLRETKSTNKKLGGVVVQER